MQPVKVLNLGIVYYCILLLYQHYRKTRYCTKAPALKFTVWFGICFSCLNINAPASAGQQSFSPLHHDHRGKACTPYANCSMLLDGTENDSSMLLDPMVVSWIRYLAIRTMCFTLFYKFLLPYNNYHYLAALTFL